MRYRNTKTGAVIDSNSVISGDDWQEIAPAGFAVKKELAIPKEAPEKGETEAPIPEEKPEAAEEPAKEPEQEEKPAKEKGKGAVIKPKKGK